MIRKLWQSHRKLLGFLCLTVLGILTTTQNVRAQAVMGARELGMGQATTALPSTQWAVFSNPALMSEDQKSVAFYAARYFGLSEITDMAAALTYPTNLGVIAAGMHRYGYDLFNKSRLRLGYKNSFLGFHFGAVLNYSYIVQGGGYGSAGALGVDVGLAAPIVSGLWIGAHATNINQPKYGSLNNEKLSRLLSVGLSYQLSNIALFSTDIVKDVDFPITYRAGVEVKVIGDLVGRAGITTEPQTFSAGFGYRNSFWGANVAVQRHQDSVLGYSPAIDFNLRW
ncbi:MAG TPA: hypothetical protein VJ964_13840 [Balneolaceae bacterium]|nr:hypothetical protein [Balneolaceae bacterium]